MNKHLKIIAVPSLAVAILATSAAAFAQQAVKPEALIKTRQSAFQLVAYSSGRIKASVDGLYNKEDVLKAANTIAAISNSGLGALFALGTETGKGWHDTAAKPELFKDGKRFAELGANFSKEANELVKVINTGTGDAVKEQYGKLTKTCKACHDDFKAKE